VTATTSQVVVVLAITIGSIMLAPAVAGTQPLPSGETTPTTGNATVAEQTATEGAGRVQVIIRFNSYASPQTHEETATVDDLKPKTAAAQSFISHARANSSITVTKRLWLADAVLASVNTTKLPLAAIAARDDVSRVHRDYELNVATTTATHQSTPDTATTTGLQPATYGLTQINVPATWRNYSTKGEGATVAVLDTGVDQTNHSDLSVSSTGWFDPVNGRSTPYDNNGHGTHVSGTVVGERTGLGTHYGVAPNATLLHAKVAKQSGRANFSTIIEGMEWAVSQDADIILMSLGATGYYDTFVTPVTNARQAGTVVIASSGNRGVNSSSTPGNIYPVISVGATDSDETVPTFSSGETVVTGDSWNRTQTTAAWPQTYTVPDVVAPGANVRSAVRGGGYATKDGTSMAAPHVAGIAALAQSATNKTLQPAEIETAIRATARPPAGQSTIRPERYGNGIVNTERTVQRVTGPPRFITEEFVAPQRITQNTTYNITTTIANVGEKPGRQDITYTLSYPNGSRILNRSLRVDLLTEGKTSLNMSVSANKTEPLLGQYTQQIATENDSTNLNLTVSAAPAAGPGDITGDGSPAQDLDGDGLYEDVNGDGKANLRDIKPFFDYLVTSSHQPPGFDFNNDGATDLQDLRPFFDLVRS
jgi:hypothetical protein